MYKQFQYLSLNLNMCVLWSLLLSGIWASVLLSNSPMKWPNSQLHLLNIPHSMFPILNISLHTTPLTHLLKEFSTTEITPRY